MEVSLSHLTTDVRNFTDAPFAFDVLESFDPLRYKTVSSHIGSVNLNLVVGTTHPDYESYTWADLKPNPGQDGLLKRGIKMLKELKENPGYYTDNAPKEQWCFYELNGKYYIEGGNNRTVTARWHFWETDQEPIVNGVTITTLTKKRYFPINEILAKHTIMAPPDVADFIRVDFKGVTVDVYGVLHGITGGTNKVYRDFVNRTIASAQGPIYSEKEMKHLYTGVDVEVDDWIQLPTKDTFYITLNFLATPIHWFSLVYRIFKEIITKHDRFTSNPIGKLSDIGGSPYFHLIHPHARREIAGFPSPVQYFRINMDRRNNMLYPAINEFPDPDWKWLNNIEPFTNIPYRSVHMIEFAVAHAKLTGKSHISLIVGEIHNTDIEWYVASINNKTISEEIMQVTREIRSTAKVHAQDITSNKKVTKQTGRKIALKLTTTATASVVSLFWIYLTSLAFRSWCC